ncbi:hypothetical protein A9P82_12495 [Arachidicoccus ginsenosidimutans]|uniref:DUF4252 domain-containing protein n=1 Tax=Arachidicoccus sp. BS20 TaxID=1850526 RepID=UPI0007F097E5|nr:DUF4252 domain-containing protein [Arachidicoccus sp. BS20]ANI90028.1 hypothetical protein A9P82_12495 [Arachidicoccus sp. BS20]
MKQFKKIIVLFAAIFLLCTQAFSQSDAIGKFFNQYVNDDNFTVVSISPKMFKMLSKVNWDDVSPDVKQTVSQITSLRLLETEKNAQQIYRDAARKLNLASYEELMTVRDGGDNVKFLVKENNNIISELLMLVGSDDDFVLMSITGNIDLDKMAKLGQTLNIQDMDKLKNVRKKK